MDIQLYSGDTRVESDSNACVLVTLTNVDLSQLNGQVTLDDLLSGWDIADVHSWVEEKLKDEN